jgi:NAD(P)H-hydrate epimerase
VRTVTFAALKPGLLQGDGPDHAGEVVVADIGLDVSGARAHLVEDADVVAWVPPRAPSDHKWRHAVWVVAGSPLMRGAGWLCSRSAMRGGAGYVRTSSPGLDVPDAPREAVGAPLPSQGWGAEVAEGASRFAAVVVGPGLGRHPGVREELVALLAGTTVPVLLDADALVALGSEPLAHSGPLVLTPHDGEYHALMGEPPGPDRFLAARDAAAHHDAVVLLKGPTTLVADPEGQALAACSGDARLATAGSGDVLSGLIGAHLAAGAPPLRAAAAGAHLHGLAGRMAGEEGVVADDVAEVLGDARAALDRR